MTPLRRIALAAVLALGSGAGAATIGAEPPKADRVQRVLEAPASIEPMYLGDSEKKKVPRPARIVTVAPSATELIFALGAGDRIRGVSRYDDYPEAVAAVPKVGGFLDPNVEAILALHPDLVVGVPNAGNRPALERIAGFGVPVLVVPGNTLADVFHAGGALGAALGGDAPARARRLTADLERDLRALSEKAAGARPPRVAFVYGWSPLVLAGPNSFADSMLVLLNAKNVVKRGPDYLRYSVEKLIEDQPEVIIDASEAHGEKDGAEPWARWTSIPAVKARRVHRIPLGDVLRPGPRIATGMRRVAEILHPLRFR